MVAQVAVNHSQSRRGFKLNPDDNHRLANLCGPVDAHLRLLEKRLGVSIDHRGNLFNVSGDAAAVEKTEKVLHSLYREARNEEITEERIQLELQEASVDALMAPEEEHHSYTIQLRRKTIKARGENQVSYLQNIQANDVSFGIGPAGTGKTYLAVASAVEALEKNLVRRLILVRPAVEAGERLGFLPGDMAQKIDPYLRPLYDALYEMLGFETVAKLQERHVIEVAPLAFMRGRTLNEAYVILDEAQNTTIEQMKMFLTRVGFGSKVIITGDMTQTDLPRHVQSGLRHASEVLQDVEGISFSSFNQKDVVRHPVVQRIVAAYESHPGSTDKTS